MEHREAIVQAELALHEGRSYVVRARIAAEADQKKMLYAKAVEQLNRASVLIHDQGFSPRDIGSRSDELNALMSEAMRGNSSLRRDI